MKTILVTGLDGSGKSTFFSKIIAAEVKDVVFIFVPHISLQPLEHGSMVYRCAEFVDKLSAEADFHKEPRLKALSVFAAMLLFRELVKHQVQPETRYVLCERHPVIDSGVYAHFYASKMDPAGIPQSLLEALDAKYNAELNHLLNLLPPSIHLKSATLSGRLAEVIYTWFHLAQKTSIDELAELFGVQSPDEIYFLHAAPEILAERLKERSRHEPHESPEVLHKLNAAYKSVLEQVQVEGQTIVEFINAESFSVLNQFADRMLNEINK